MRIFLCDDEPLALDRLKGLVARCEGADIVGAHSGGEGAVAQIEQLRPDLLLLDIEMPKLDGFDIVDAVSRLDWAGLPPLVIFVTAHPGYAFEAFDSGAIDFISKPVRLHRLERALGRARTALDQRQSAQRLSSLTQSLEALRRSAAHGAQPRHLWVQKRSERIRLELDAIETIEAEGEYVRLHAEGASYLHRGSLTAFAEQLGEASFLRVHRSAVVNCDHVAGVTRSGWGVVLRLKSGRTLRVGRSYRQAVRRLMGGDGGA